MESIANSSGDVLIDALSYKIGNSASYITDRKSVTFFPSGSNIYSTEAGTKVIKFSLSSEGWLDPSTVRINFNLKKHRCHSRKICTTFTRWSFVFQAFANFSKWCNA